MNPIIPTMDRGACRSLGVSLRFATFGLAFLVAAPMRAEVTAVYRQVASDGMDPSANGNTNRNWNFDDTSITTFNGWQYAAYWNDGDVVDGTRRYRVAVARRPLDPLGDWSVTELADYHRNQDTDAPSSAGANFGDGHEKVAIGISPDGYIHLVFDLHVDHLHYVRSREPVALMPASTTWNSAVFSPVRRSLEVGGPGITRVTYPRFLADRDRGRFALYLRTGASGNGDSHLFDYDSTLHRWVIASEGASRFLDNETTVYPDGTVNAYPIFAAASGSLHMLWTWRGTPDANTCFDIAHAYSPDFGAEWRGGRGVLIGTRGAANGSAALISADDPDVTAVDLPLTRIINSNFAATVGLNRDVHVYYQDRETGTRHYRRRSGSQGEDAGGQWSEAFAAPTVSSPVLVTAPNGGVFLVSKQGVHQIGSDGAFTRIATPPAAAQFGPADIGVDYQRLEQTGVLSVLGQTGGTTVFTVDYADLPPPADATLRITTDPAAQTVAPGGRATLTVEIAEPASGGQVSYRWRKDGELVPGANGATLALEPVSPADSGRYDVEVSDGVSAVRSRAAVLLVATPEPGRLRNLSVRSRAGAEAATLVTGFVVEGGAMRVLVRGVGPTLSAYGVASAMPNPGVTLFRGQTPVADNEDWGDGGSGTSAAIAAAAATVGAFPLAAGSKDAGMVTELAGAHTVHLRGAEAGIGLAEVYEVGAGAGRLVNVSARTFTGTGADVLVVGFVIDGNVPRRLLLRGIGPELARYGVEGTVEDPVLRVFDAAGKALASNDDWRADEVATMADAVGAFPLTVGSRDAALVLGVTPGAYTAHVGSGNGDVGIALVEVYQLP